MKIKLIHLPCCLLLSLMTSMCLAQVQSDSIKKVRQFKNVIRYNLSGALLFGTDKYIVLGYERVIKPHQSFSINFGMASLPKFFSISTDSVDLDKDKKNTGYNISVDYRFYLPKENKHAPPHGLYIGPYYSFNKFIRDNQWKLRNSAGQTYLDTHANLSIHTVGFQLGYQFILWKRLALDFVMIGPGLGFYHYKVELDSNVSAETRQNVYEGLEQLLQQKFPGMNYVFSDKHISGDGTIRTNTLGYRYIIHIGYTF